MISSLTQTPPALSVAQDALREARLQLSKDTAARADRAEIRQGQEEVALARRAVADAQAAALRDATTAAGLDLYL